MEKSISGNDPAVSAEAWSLPDRICYCLALLFSAESRPLVNGQKVTINGREAFISIRLGNILIPSVQLASLCVQFWLHA